MGNGLARKRIWANVYYYYYLREREIQIEEIEEYRCEREQETNHHFSPEPVFPPPTN
jgi:hypothetical protein